MNAALLRDVVLPTWQYVKGQNSLRLLQELERTQWLTRRELEDLQWQRLEVLLRHAYDHVPYYARAMREAGVLPDTLVRNRTLEPLPLLDRSTITKQRDALKAGNFPADRFVPNGTGGSTGEPLRFFDDRQELGWSSAAVWRSQRWVGVDIGERCAYLWGANFDISSFQGISGRVKSGVLNMLMLPAWELSESMAPVFLQQLIAFRPRLLLAYAGALHQLARLLGPRQSRVPELRAIIVSAETLADDARASIEGCFGVPVYNRYGGRDLKFVAQECDRRMGLHLNAETALVEIVKDGRPAPAGELGEIVLTRLDNLAMPFIRYRTGDLGVMAEGRCACGRALPMLARVEGRVQDAIRGADGRIVTGLFFAHMMKDCPDVKEFQVHQLENDLLRILIVPAPGAEFVSSERIVRIVQRYTGEGMRVEFEQRDTIPLTRSGKRRITISHLDQ